MATTQASVGGIITAAQENQSFDIPDPISLVSTPLQSIINSGTGPLPTTRLSLSIVLTRITLVQVKYSVTFGGSTLAAPTSSARLGVRYAGAYVESPSDEWSLVGVTPGTTSPGHMVRDLVVPAGTLTVELYAGYNQTSGFPMRNFTLAITPIRPI